MDKNERETERENWAVHPRELTHENSRIKEVISKEVTNDITQENFPEMMNLEFPGCKSIPNTQKKCCEYIH